MLNMLLAIIMSTYDSVVNKMPGSAETLWSQLGETSATASAAEAGCGATWLRGGLFPRTPRPGIIVCARST